MRGLVDFLRGALRRLPVESVAVGATAASLSCAVHGLEGVWVARVVLAALLATPVAFALHGRGRAVELGGGLAALATAYGALALTLGDLHQLDRAAFAWPYGLALLAAVLTPFVAAAPRFTRFVRRFFEQVTTWGLLWGGAMIALAVVLAALSELFHLDVKRAGADVALAITAGFVLVLLDRLLPDQQPAGRMPELWRRLATTIGAPFVSVMLVILVAYEAVVLLRGELPQNLLSPLIMAAGFVGFGCTLIIAAVAGEPAGTAQLASAAALPFTRRFSVRLARAFPLVLLALLPMAGWALFVRVEQYGLTPFRVARASSLACLAVLCALSGLRWLRRREPLTWQVPATVAAFALATAFGPTSAVRLSIASQAARLERLLVESGVPARRVAASPPAGTVTVAPERHAELVDAVRQLAELGGAAALGRVLDGDLAPCVERWSGAATCVERLGVVAGERPAPSYRTAIVAAEVPLDGARLWFIALDRGHRHPSGLELGAAEVTLGAARASLAEAIAAARGGTSLPAAPLELAPGGRLLLQRIDVLDGEAYRVEGVLILR